MEPVVDNIPRSDGTAYLDGDDPSRCSSSAPSSSPSFCADPSSPKHSRSRSRTPSPTSRKATHSFPTAPCFGPAAAAQYSNQGLASRPDSGSQSLSTTLSPSPSSSRTPINIPPPSSMPPSTSPLTAPGPMMTFVRASTPCGRTYGTPYPYTQPQQQHHHQQEPQLDPQAQQHKPMSALHPHGLVPTALSPRANSAPPSRATIKGRFVALSSGDWGQPAEAAGALAQVLGEPTGSVVKPYGFLPPPPNAPPLKPRWPTARLVSSRRSAAAAFTSFAAAPSAALRITGVAAAPAGGGAATSTAAAAAVVKAAAVAPAGPAPPPTPAPPSSAPSRPVVAHSAASSKTCPPRRFSSQRTRCLADNLAHLHRGNTYNPPLNERISQLLEVVLPRPTTASMVLPSTPSPRTPPAAAPPPPPPEAASLLDRALQQHREAAVAERSPADGSAAAEAAAALHRWSSRRGGGGPASRALIMSSPWQTRGAGYGIGGIGGSADWGDGGGGLGLAGAGAIGLARRGTGPLVGADAGHVGGGGTSTWELPYTPENVAATVAAVAAAAAARHSNPEALHLQGVSYRAAKAATRAMSDMNRPGISLRMHTMTEDSPPPTPPAPPPTQAHVLPQQLTQYPLIPTLPHPEQHPQQHPQQQLHLYPQQNPHPQQQNPQLRNQQLQHQHSQQAKLCSQPQPPAHPQPQLQQSPPSRVSTVLQVWI